MDEVSSFDVLKNKDPKPKHFLHGFKDALVRFNVLVKPDLFCSFCEKLLAEQANSLLVEEKVLCFLWF